MNTHEFRNPINLLTGKDVVMLPSFTANAWVRLFEARMERMNLDIKARLIAYGNGQKLAK